MYKLLIIDDEKQVRETLARMVPWESLGIGTVETARNGMDALERLAGLRPDLVLCDVRMPKMDGMTFAGHLHRILPNCRILFISGYADKDVMKSAIRLQAANFIEKPIDLVELSSAIRDIISGLKMEEFARQQQRSQFASLQENLPAILERAALGLSNKDGDWERERKRLERAGCRFLDQGPFLTLAIQVEWDGLMTSDEQITAKADILSRLNSPLPQGSGKIRHAGVRFPHLAGFCSDEMMVVILTMTERMDHDPAVIATELLHIVDSVRPGRISSMAGLGAITTHVEKLSERFRQAVESVHQLFYRDNTFLIARPDDTPGQAFIPHPQLFSRFLACVRQGNLEELSDLLHELTSEAITCHDGNINHVRNIYFDLVTATLESAPKSRMESFWKADQPYLWSRFGRMTRISDLSEFVLEFIRTRLRQEEPEDGKTKTILGYLQQNYQRTDLSLRDIAETVHLSQSYLCSLFKKTMGITMVEYTTGLRIARAEELLQNEELKLYVIAEQTGFGDANYFSTIFKKTKGITPSEYRDRLRE